MAKKIVDFKVYDIDYLMNAELTEEDLHNLFDTASLIGSLILEEFKLIGSKLSQNEIIKLVKDKESRWYNQFQWNMEQHEKFAKQLAKVMKNVYSYDDETAERKASWFLLFYGLQISDYDVNKRLK
jgi:hypothetical protein